MALVRMQGNVYRFLIAFPQLFADWENPTVAELNSNPDNDPHGAIFNLTCAMDTDGTTFDLNEPEMDDSTSFCQKATDQEPMADNVEVIFQFFRATSERATDDPSRWNNAHLAFTLLAWRGVEYFAILSVGEEPDEPFAVGQEVSMAKVATDWGVDSIGTGEPVRMIQNFAFRGDVNWRHTLGA